MKRLVLLILITFCYYGEVRSENSDSIVLRGTVPYRGFTGLEEKINNLWLELKTVFGNRETPSPVIYFSDFTKEKQSKSVKGEGLNDFQISWVKTHPEIWVDWAKKNKIPLSEITEEWINENVEKKMAFPKDFLAFQYSDTNVLQLSADKTFYAHFQNNSQGRKVDMTGFGYYVVGHEMTHYLLNEQGISSRLQHCLMFRTEMMDKFASYLQKTGLGKFQLSRYIGLSEKFCDFLTEEEKLEVEELSKEYNSIDYGSSN